MSPREQLVQLLPKLRLHAYRLTRSQQTAEDLLQNTCLRAMDRLVQWQGTSFYPWILKIMERLWFNELRSKRVRGEDLLEDPDLLPGGTFQQASDARLYLSQLYYAEVISQEDFTLLARIHLYEWSYQEVAEDLGKPIGTVLSRVSRAKASLKRALDEKRI